MTDLPHFDPKQHRWAGPCLVAGPSDTVDLMEALAGYAQHVVASLDPCARPPAFRNTLDLVFLQGAGLDARHTWLCFAAHALDFDDFRAALDAAAGPNRYLVVDQVAGCAYYYAVDHWEAI